MAKYHLKDNGEPGVCRAQPGKCPKAKDSEHFTTKEAANKAYEKKMEKDLLARFKKSPGPSYVDEQYRERVARKRRVEDAMLNYEGPTVISVPYGERERNYSDRAREVYYVHPEFKKALPDKEDMAEYVIQVQMNNSLSDSERNSVYSYYNEVKGTLEVSWEITRPPREDYDEYD